MRKKCVCIKCDFFSEKLLFEAFFILTDILTVTLQMCAWISKYFIYQLIQNTVALK